MGSFSIWHWLIVLVIVMLIFGTKKLRNIGADLGGAVRGFKDGMREGGATRRAESPPHRRRSPARRSKAKSRARASTRSEHADRGRTPFHKAPPRRLFVLWRDMFDIGFSELMVIGLVALIVIGPEKLPRVARTVGHLAGRLQRYVSDVKADINREIELDELRKMRDSMQQAATEMESSVNTELHKTETELNDAVKAATQRQAGGREGAGKSREGMSDQESFISHLVELRSRLVRAVAAILVFFVALFIWPGSGPIYDVLAAPLMHALPRGREDDRHRRHHAVHGADEGHGAGRLHDCAAIGALPGLGVRRARALRAREEARPAAGGGEHGAVLRRGGASATSSCSARCSPSSTTSRRSRSRRRPTSRPTSASSSPCSSPSASPSRSRSW